MKRNPHRRRGHYLLARRRLRYERTRDAAGKLLEALQRTLLLVRGAEGRQQALPVGHLVAARGPQEIGLAAVEMQCYGVRVPRDLLARMHAPTRRKVDASLGDRLRLEEDDKAR